MAWAMGQGYMEVTANTAESLFPFSNSGKILVQGVTVEATGASPSAIVAMDGVAIFEADVANSANSKKDKSTFPYPQWMGALSTNTVVNCTVRIWFK